MKYLAFLILFFLYSCGGVQKRNADLVVTYGGKVVHSASSKYSTEKELKSALKDDKKPDFVIFSADWCAPCKVLHRVIRENDLHADVIVLNFDEDWVQYIAGVMGIRGLPAMIVTYDGGKSKSTILYGPLDILREVFNHIERKK